MPRPFLLSDTRPREARARRIRERGVVLATVGLYVTLLVIYSLEAAGVASITTRQWLLAAAVTGVVQAGLFLMVRTGADRRLRWDPHFVFVPIVCAAFLLSLYIFLAPEIRILVLMIWMVILLFVAGLVGFAGVMAVTGVMAAGYLGALLTSGAAAPAIGWGAGDFIPLTVFLVLTVFAAIVFERLRLQRAEMMALRRRLATEALTDSLTGLPNRRYFDQAIGAEVERVRRYGAQSSLALIDVDHFKNYNDTVGHPAGDEVLRTMARIIRDDLRLTDTLTRYGGEELALVMTETGPADAREVVERLRRVIESHDFPYRDVQPEGSITISAGVASAPDHAETVTDLVQRADDALYRAKRCGRNQVAVAGADETAHPAAS